MAFEGMTQVIEDHFALTGRPFALTPDPGFWFESATHKKALAYLGYGLAQGEGFIVITGEIGSGKTTLVRRLLETIDTDRLRALSLVSTALGPEDTLRAVATELGVAAPDKAGLLSAIEGALHDEARAGRRVLLIVDEAQNLPDDALEELRMLSNFQLGPDPLVQIVLLGQPEFRERLHGDPALEQVRQRVIATHHLGAMEPDEVGPYLIHRLTTVGWTGRPDFTEDALDAIDRWSGGLPRLVNAVAARCLLAAATEDTDVIDGELVARVAEDIAADTGPSSPATRVTGSPFLDVEPLRDARLDMLESRIAAQDMALRHVLKLLVDWMERDQPTERLRGVA